MLTDVLYCCTLQNIVTLRGGDAVEDNQTEEIISAAEFARRLGVSRSAINRYVDTGKLEPVSREFQGMKPNPKYRDSDVERLKAAREGSRGQTDIV